MLLYWRLSGVVQYNSTPIDQVSLFYNETFLWHYCAPSYREEIHSQIQSGHRVRFLSQFLLSQTEIEVEFSKIRLQTEFIDDFQFVYTDSNTYQYKFANLRWQPIRTILSFPLINPPTFSIPIMVPNTLGSVMVRSPCLSIVLVLELSDRGISQIGSRPNISIRKSS